MQGFSCSSTKGMCCKPKAKPTPARRYRRSPQTRAPRKRTFIANMNKYIIDFEMPSGLAGESFFGASTLCSKPCPCPSAGGAARSAKDAGSSMAVTALPIMMEGGGDGGSVPRGGLTYNNGDDDNYVDDQIYALPIIVALALGVALYPAIQALAPPLEEAAPSDNFSTLAATEQGCVSTVTPSSDEEEVTSIELMKAFESEGQQVMQLV